MFNNPFVYSDDKLRYHSYSYYLKTKYKHKVTKVPLDAGFTCPNRDGKLAHGGCRFCSKDGSGDFIKDKQASLMNQYDIGLAQMHTKWPDALGIAYFQAYSNTYASVDTLKSIYEPFVERKDVLEIAIGTRSDCLSDEVIDYLDSINKRKPLTVEIGLQSIHDETTDALNCLHHYSEFLSCYPKLKACGIRVSVHIINGLPHETKEMMIETARQVGLLKPDGIKIHMLNILKDSYLYDDYLNEPFSLLTKDEYIDIVVKQLELIPKETVIERLTGDGLADNLFAPVWIKKKTIVLNDISKKQKELNTYQGRLYETREY